MTAPGHAFNWVENRQKYFEFFFALSCDTFCFIPVFPDVYLCKPRNERKALNTAETAKKYSFK
jgi:hypothetical protein